MKKRNLIVALSGMGALAVAVGAVGTAAWYTAQATATVSNAAAVTGSLTTAASSTNMAGEFTITPSAIANKTNVALTDDEGKTYVSVSDGEGGYTAYQATTAGDLYATYALSATVTYVGALTDPAAIQALWESSCASVTLTLSCISASGTAVGSGAASTSDIHYITAANDFSDKANGNVITVAANTITVGTEKSFGSILVAIRGHDDVVWTGEDAAHKPSYTMQVAATHA